VSTKDRGIEIRSVRAEEFNEIEKLVETVVHEKYGHLYPGAWPPPYDPTDWSNGLVVTDHDAIVGVGLHENEWITDIWLKAEVRGIGMGTKLLSELEKRVAKDGHTTARLRCVGENEAALRFYARHGWREVKRYPHESRGFEMVDMDKQVR
jgi:GNAT superfamily N-acetyltransferase